MYKKRVVLVLFCKFFSTQAAEQNPWALSQSPQQAGGAQGWALVQRTSDSGVLVQQQEPQVFQPLQVQEDKVICGSFETIRKFLNPTAGEDFVKMTNIAVTLSDQQFSFDRFFSTLRLSIVKYNEALTGSVQEKELKKVYLISILQALAPYDDMNAARLFRHLTSENLK